MNRILIGAERLMWKEVGRCRLYGGKKSARCRIFCIIFRFHYFYAASSFSAPQLWCFHAASMLHFKYYFCLWLCAACSLTKSKMLLSSLSHSLTLARSAYAEHCNLLNVYILWDMCLPVCKNGRFLRLCISPSTNLMCKSSPNGATCCIYSVHNVVIPCTPVVL